jgi:hypothetical protein
VTRRRDLRPFPRYLPKPTFLPYTLDSLQPLFLDVGGYHWISFPRSPDWPIVTGALPASTFTSIDRISTSSVLPLSLSFNLTPFSTPA